MLSFDNLPYMGRFLLGLLAAIAVGAWLGRRRGLEGPVDRLLAFLAPPLGYVVLTLFALAILRAPFSDWNADRLAPAVGLLHGYKIYYGPARGPVLNTIYTPLSWIVYLPAALAPNPTAAILIGTTIGVALFFLPVMLLCLGPHGSDGKRSLLLGTYVLLCIARYALDSVLGVTFHIHADAPAIGFAGLACVAMYRRRRDPEPPLSAWLAPALFAALSVWSKQTMAPIVAVVPLWALMAHGPRSFARASATSAIMLSAVSLACREAFGFRAFAFNAFRLPRLHPWIYTRADATKGSLVLALEMAFLSIPLLLLALLPLYLRWRGPARSTGGEDPPAESARSRAHRWFRENAWLLFAGASLALVPTALLGRVKVGGNVNNYTPPVYFLVLGLGALVLDWYARNRERGLSGPNLALKAALLTSFFSPMNLVNAGLMFQLEAMKPLDSNPQEQAYRYAKAHPGEVYFPWNTLSTLMAEGKVYHFEHGLVDRELAGYPISDAHFRSHVPTRLRQVCFPPQRQGEWTMKYLKEFTRRVEVKELPGWICYERQ